MITIKRYPNRKLYNTKSKQYITLDGIADLIRSGEEVRVIDHAGGEDLTALTLTQIILEREKRQSGLLSNSFLTNLIRTSEDRLNALQRSLSSPIALWRQIDDEIQKRVHSLVHQGELTDREGTTLIEKLLLQGRRLREANSEADTQVMEEYLKQCEIPTRADIQKLYNQIDELSAKIEEITRSDS